MRFLAIPSPSKYQPDTNPLNRTSCFVHWQPLNTLIHISISYAFSEYQSGIHWYAGSGGGRSTFTGASLHKQPVCHPQQGKHSCTKVSSVNRDDLPFFPPRDTDGEVLVFSTHLEPTAHRGLPYVFAKALSQSHWLSIQSIEPQCLLFICCLESLTGYTDKTLIKTSSVTSCDIKAAWVLEPSVTSWRSPCLWGRGVFVRACLFVYEMGVGTGKKEGLDFLQDILKGNMLT